MGVYQYRLNDKTITQTVFFSSQRKAVINQYSILIFMVFLTIFFLKNFYKIPNIHLYTWNLIKTLIKVF